MKRTFLVLIAALLTLGVAGIGTVRPTFAATDVVTTCSGDPTVAGSLPYEVTNAAASDTITFGVDCPSSSPITLSSPITISKALTIDGTGHSISIDGGNGTQLFTLSTPNTGFLMLVTLNDLGLQNGKGAAGAAIQNGVYGYVTISNSTFSGNSASGNGGAISNTGEYGTVNVVGSTFSGNSAVNGGAIYSTTIYGSAHATDSAFSGNRATGEGGAIYNGDSNLTVGGNSSGDSSFSGNSAGSGGAIYNLGDVTVQSGSSLSGNSAGSGGAIYNGLDGSTVISGSTVSNNVASCGSFGCTADGGAIDSSQGFVTITSSTLAGNSVTCSGTFCSGSGGAVYNGSGTTSIGTSTFVGNAATYGGAVYSQGTTSIGTSTLAGNSATSGGAIYNADLVYISGSIVASTSGGNCGHYSVTDNGYNLEWTGDATAGYSCGFSSANHDIVGQDPRLVTDGSGAPLLASNGGPTQTIALQAGGPAVDEIPTGQAGCQASGGKDQRGVTRPDNGEVNCDIGAYEYDGPDVLTQTISWPAPAQTTYAYGDNPFTVSATASSGLPVSFSIDSNSSSVCSADGATITILSVGTCKVLADQAGDSTYAPAPEVSQIFTITKAPLSVTANAKTMTYGGTVPSFDATLSGLAGGDTFASLGGNCSGTAYGAAISASTPAGSYPIAITCSGVSDTNYSVTYTAGRMTVNQATSSTTVGTSLSPTTQGQKVTFTAMVSPQYTGTPSGSVTFYDGSTVLGSATLTNGQASITTTALTIGSHAITAVYGGDRNFLASTSSSLAQYVDTNLSKFPTTSSGAYNLTSVNLAGAYLVGANLAGATITSANLSGTNLAGANLKGANLTSANLTNANLSNVDLTGANLTRTNLKGATGLSTATLTGVTWNRTNCPDNTNSNSDGGSCTGHL